MKTDEEEKSDLREALLYSADMLSAEHFDFCVHEFPEIALRCCPDRLTAEQKKYCEETIRMEE